MSRKLFDVHTHFVPDVYRQAAIAAGWGKPDGMPGIPAWTERGMIEMMDAIGIDKGILSISSPGVFFGDKAAARALSRQVNLEGAALKQRWPDRLGLFASLPLPDVEAALAEIAFAYDELGVEGIYLQSNAGGIYPGDTAFEPVFAELDRRQAIVFLHPTSQACPCCGDRERPMPRPVLDFMFETTRAVTNLILSGTLDRYPDIKLIVPHGGATLPVLLDRIVWTAGMMPNMTDMKQEAIRAAFGRLYFDLADAPTPRQLPALRTFADSAHLLYGSDWPHTPQPIVAQLREELDVFLAEEPNFRSLIYYENAAKLFGNFYDDETAKLHSQN